MVKGKPMSVGAVLENKLKTQTPIKRYWLGSINSKDDFGIPIKKEFIEGRTKQGPWAIMTPQTWKVHGFGVLGVGYGQRYERQADGRWMKVEG